MLVKTVVKKKNVDIKIPLQLNPCNIEPEREGELTSSEIIHEIKELRLSVFVLEERMKKMEEK